MKKKKIVTMRKANFFPFPIFLCSSPNAHLKKQEEENFIYISFVTDNESNFYCVSG